ncbi:MAG: cupin domain-containing protein [Herpetosiphonaceae bacterium]|nr:cupin domain-containing protein [Herpetosiphonaceae bacterium]
MTHNHAEFTVLAGAATALDLPALIASATHDGVIWKHTSDQLNLNLLRFQQGDGIPAHRNDVVDVLIMALAGTGVIRIAGESHYVGAGSILLIPCGCERAITATSAQFAYLSCHQRRGGLQPTLPGAS